MSDRVIIFDTTLRDGEQSPGATMDLSEKIRIARQLETLGVDVIEAGFPAASEGDFEAVKAMLGTISDTLAAGGHIELRGFGIFEVVTRCQRVGRNPNNPTVSVKIPAQKVVKFRAGAELEEKVAKLKLEDSEE